MAIKEGELIRYNPFDDEIELQYIEDEEKRESLPTIGYYAMFEYHNGFKKILYWSREKMEAHAIKYSAGYASDKKKGTAYTFWAKDFDSMGIKTMLRQLISKWGVLSVDMQKGFEADQGVIRQDGTVEYVDVPEDNPIPVSAEPVQEAAPVEAEAPETLIPEDDFAAIMEG